MPPRFSIIVPVYREQGNISACLDALAGLARIEEAEVIVVDGGAGSTLAAIPPGRRPYLLRPVESPPGRGRQMNAGAALAAGQVLVFLHVDTFLPEGALGLIEGALGNGAAGQANGAAGAGGGATGPAGCPTGGAAAGAFSVDHPSGSLFKWWVGVLNLFKRMFRTPYGDQAYFLKRETFRALGGFEEIPIMEDVALMRRLHRRHLPVRILRSRVMTSDRRWRRSGYTFNFLRNLLLLWLYFLGVPPRLLARWYRPNSAASFPNSSGGA